MKNYVKHPATIGGYKFSDPIQVEAMWRYRLLRADEEDCWEMQQHAYDLLNAPWSRRLFRSDIAGNGILDEYAREFLSFAGVNWHSSPAALFLPSKLAEKYHRYKYGFDKIEIPKELDKEQALEEMSQIWFSALSDSGVLPEFGRHMLRRPSTMSAIYRKAIDAGVYPMLKAWSIGVPIEDILA